MKLGIVSDIHEAVELLETALSRFESLGVDRVVILGDVFETGPRVDETVALLKKARAVGVFGNHDYGLSVCPREDDCGRFSPESIAFMMTLEPRMEIDGCLFAHREPWLDGSDLCDIWHVDEDPLTPELIVRSFDSTPHSVIFAGHFHQWMVMTRQGRVEWDGSTPITPVARHTDDDHRQRSLRRLRRDF